MKTLALTLLFIFLTSCAYAGSSHKSPKRHELRCLAENVYFEARSESLAGQMAVAIVTLNRVKSPHYPDNLCKVVHMAKAFSWTANPQPILDMDAWRVAVEIAVAAIKGVIPFNLQSITHFHTIRINPYWASSLKHIKTIGNHKFYGSK